MTWTITRKSPSVIDLDLGAREGSALIISDVHWDNAHCDRAALKRDLDEAVERGAPILIFGDLFCLMQGKWDKRKDEKQLRPEHRGGRYLDAVVDTATEWFAPYAEHIAFMSYGNHETSIIQHHETDILQRFDTALRLTNPKYRGVVGAYAGFMRLTVWRNTSPDGLCAKTLAWNHGYGGGGEHTRGLLDNARTRSQAFADIFVSGHIHRRNLDENTIISLDPTRLVLRQHQQWFLRASTYKREDGSHEGNMSGWHVEKGRTARPLGGWWLNMKSARTPQSEGELFYARVQPVPTWG